MNKSLEPWVDKSPDKPLINIIVKLENYYREIRDFKSFFIRNCLVDKKYEAYKIWAHWLIRNLCDVSENYHIIPPLTINEDDQIITHLIEKGSTEEEAENFYNNVISRVEGIYHRYHQFKVDLLHNPNLIDLISSEITYSTYQDEDITYHLYRLHETYTKHNELKHHKLLKQYKGKTNQLKFYMFETGFNYYILDGHSLQWCVPPKVIDILYRDLGVRTELFASPTNSNMPLFCSLFYVDRMFGSLDNMFNLDPEQTLEGVFEVNPPFIETIFIRSSKMIINFLQKSQAQNKELMFIYVMPDWLDSLGYQCLTESEYLIDELVLEENKHYYYQSSNDRMVRANFESHVLVLGTAVAYHRWTDQVKANIIRNFCYNDWKTYNPHPFKHISQL